MTARGNAVFLLSVGLVVTLGLASAAGAVDDPPDAWMKVAPSGFGDVQNSSLAALASFSGSLYAGTGNDGNEGGQLWRQVAGTWSSVMIGGFGNAANYAVNCLGEFRSQLYAGTYNEATGCEIWRTGDGTTWSKVVSGGLGSSENAEVMHLAVFGNRLYACTWCVPGKGAEIWRSGTGNSGDWSRVVMDGFADADNGVIMTLEPHGGYLYAATGHQMGGQVWRSSTGNTGSWRKVNANGFGDVGNWAVTSLASFNGYLYAATHHMSGEGGEVWRCHNCDGNDWQRVVDNGLGNAEARRSPALEAYGSRLFLIMGNWSGGAMAWRTTNGTQWESVGPAGLGNPNSVAPNYDNSTTVYQDRLYVGLTNFLDGGEVYVYPCDKLLLPWVAR